jgi:hypothetical protein
MPEGAAAGGGCSPKIQKYPADANSNTVKGVDMKLFQNDHVLRLRQFQNS